MNICVLDYTQTHIDNKIAAAVSSGYTFASPLSKSGTVVSIDFVCSATESSCFAWLLDKFLTNCKNLNNVKYKINFKNFNKTHSG